MEEIIESHRNSRAENEHKSESRINQQNGPLENKRNGEEVSQVHRFQRNRFERFIPLNMTQTEVLIKIEGSNILKKPTPIKQPFRLRNRSIADITSQA